MLEKKLKKNDELEVVIERIGSNGEGIAVVDGIVIFVPFALVGERVLIHIINDKNSFLIAKVVKVLTPSKQRVVAPCPHFAKCGGCDIQHMCQSEQLKTKKLMVENALEKFAKINVKTNEVVASNKQFRYRNKFAFPVQDVNGEIKIGMFQKNSHRIIEVEDCLLQSENAKLIVKLFKEFMIENKISAYNEQTKKGDVKHIVVREHGDEFILTVVVTNKKFNKFEPLILKLKQQFNSFGIVKNVNNLNNNVIFGNFDEKIYGIQELGFEEFGISYTVNNRSFLQVNDYIKNLIYKKIIETLGDQTNVIDAYSGAGLLSSIIAKNTQNVWGVEIVKEATENANNLKLKNNLYNLTNKNGDCSEVIPELAKQLQGDFAVVVDPPRKGLDKKVVETFLHCEPSKIVYLSCDPATLARDLGLLKEKYDVEFVQPYDMFPQTANVETLVCLNLKNTHSKTNEEKLQKEQEKKKKILKNKKKSQKTREKSRYFDFYDDVKHDSHRDVAWWKNKNKTEKIYGKINFNCGADILGQKCTRNWASKKV